MDLFDAIRGRRSVRSFKPQQVQEEVLNKILEAGIWAPSAGNLQSWEFIIVKDPRVKMALCRAALSQRFIYDAPLNIVVCADRQRSARYYGSRGWDFYSLCDSSAAIQNILLAVHALGLGACWVGSFQEEQVSRILRLPSYVRPIAIIPMGYPGKEPEGMPNRIPLEKLTHKEKYEH